MVNKINKLFLIGLPRSGTSLLFRLVNNHSKISLIYESDIFYIWPQLLANVKTCDWLSKLHQWNNQLNRHPYKVEAKCLNKNDAIEYFYQSLANQKTLYVGEKSAMYANYLKKVEKYYPEAKIIIIQRNLLEIVESMKRAEQSGDRFFLNKRLKNKIIADQYYLYSWCRNTKLKHLKISYNELVENNAAVLNEIYSYLELEKEENKSNQDNLMPKGEHHTKAHAVEIKKEKYISLLSKEEQEELLKLQLDIENNVYSSELKKIIKLAKIENCIIVIKTIIYWILPANLIAKYRKL